MRSAPGTPKNGAVFVFAHRPFWDIQYPAPDSEQVRQIFRKYPRTVLAVINGHVHTDHFAVLDHIAFWDVNTARLGGWRHRDDYHYADDMTYPYQDYAEGSKVGEEEQLPINSMTQARNSWFFKDPLSAVVTVTEEGFFRIDGSETQWLYGIEPDYDDDGMKPSIADRQVWLWGED